MRPNMGRPLFDSASVASSWITSQCSASNPFCRRTTSATIQLLANPWPEKPDEIKKPTAARGDVGAMLNVVGRPESFCRYVISLVEKQFKRFENHIFIVGTTNSSHNSSSFVRKSGIQKVTPSCGRTTTKISASSHQKLFVRWIVRVPMRVKGVEGAPVIIRER
jgi:hypothetical protein